MTSGEHTNPMQDFRPMAVIDGHLHVWRSSRRRPAGQRRFAPRRIWETLALAGVERCNALSLNDFSDGSTLNAEALHFKRTAQGAAYAFGSLDYTRHFGGEKMDPSELVQQAQALRSRGFDGVKMWEGKPAGYVRLPGRLDGPFYAPFFAWMEEAAFPIILHLSDAPRFWDPQRAGLDPWSYAGPQYPTRAEMHAELETILARHPRLRLTVAHLLFLWGELDEARRLLQAHPSLCFDLTPGVLGYLELSRDPQAAQQFFLEFQDRLIYGTDIGALPLLDLTAGFDPQREAGQPRLVRAFLETACDVPFPSGVGILNAGSAGERLRGIDLPEAALEQIYRLNFERVTGAFPAVLPGGWQ